MSALPATMTAGARRLGAGPVWDDSHADCGCARVRARWSIYQCRVHRRYETERNRPLRRRQSGMVGLSKLQTGIHPGSFDLAIREAGTLSQLPRHSPSSKLHFVLEFKICNGYIEIKTHAVKLSYMPRRTFLMALSTFSNSWLTQSGGSLLSDLRFQRLYVQG